MRISGVLGWSLLLLTARAQTPAYDVVIRNGRVLDGCGNPWIRADVAIKEVHFARSGKIDGRGRIESDAQGRYVSPGWIDVMDQSGCVAAEWSGGKQKGIGINFSSYFSETQARIAVLANDARAPNPEELARMKAILETAMKAGVIGMTTALIYPPSSFATTVELTEMARVAARYGGLYASHIRGEGREVVELVDEAIAIGEHAGLPVGQRCAG